MAATNGMSRVLEFFNDKKWSNPIGIFSILLLGLLTGCASWPPARLVADYLETVPPGTAFDEMRTADPKLIQVSKYSFPRGVRQSIDEWIMVDPCDSNTLTLYRQWPSAVLLTLKSDDQFIPLDVRDGIHTGGYVLLLLTADSRYLGYFAVSSRSYSRDRPERKRSEIRAYRHCGLSKLIPGAEKRLELRLKGENDQSCCLPPLPLSKLLE